MPLINAQIINANITFVIFNNQFLFCSAMTLVKKNKGGGNCINKTITARILAKIPFSSVLCPKIFHVVKDAEASKIMAKKLKGNNQRDF